MALNGTEALTGAVWCRCLFVLLLVSFLLLFPSCSEGHWPESGDLWNTELRSLAAIARSAADPQGSAQAFKKARGVVIKAYKRIDR